MRNRIIALILFLLVFFCLLNACTANEQINQRDETITYSRGIYHDKDWDSSILTYEGNAIPDEKCALAIAEAIYESLPGDEIKGLVPAEVFFDEEDKVWIVLFWEPPQPNGPIALGGGLTIALRQEDGKVLRIRLEE